MLLVLLVLRVLRVLRVLWVLSCRRPLHQQLLVQRVALHWRRQLALTRIQVIEPGGGIRQQAARHKQNNGSSLKMLTQEIACCPPGLWNTAVSSLPLSQPQHCLAPRFLLSCSFDATTSVPRWCHCYAAPTSHAALFSPGIILIKTNVCQVVAAVHARLGPVAQSGCVRCIRSGGALRTGEGRGATSARCWAKKLHDRGIVRTQRSGDCWTRCKQAPVPHAA